MSNKLAKTSSLIGFYTHTWKPLLNAFSQKVLSLQEVDCITNLTSGSSLLCWFFCETLAFQSALSTSRPFKKGMMQSKSNSLILGSPCSASTQFFKNSLTAASPSYTNMMSSQAKPKSFKKKNRIAMMLNLWSSATRILTFFSGFGFHRCERWKIFCSSGTSSVCEGLIMFSSIIEGVSYS